MKDFDHRLLPEEGVAMLTAPHIDGVSPFYLADFRDTQVIVYKPTGHFLGFKIDTGLRLCRGPVRMINGMWIAHDDPEANSRELNVNLTLELLDFKPI